MKQTFEEWFEDVLMYARWDSNEDLVARAPFMYEDYYEAGIPAGEAYAAEWSA